MKQNVRTARLLICLLIFVSMTAVIASAQETTSLWIMTHTYEQYNNWLTEKIAEYMELYPDVEITYTHVSHGDLNERITVSLASGSAPDIMNVFYPSMVDLMKGGFLAQAPPFVIDDLSRNFIPTILDAMTIEGRVYGYPTEAMLILPVANEYLYETSGLDYPDSYEDLLDIQRKMTTYTSDGTVVRRGAQLDNTAGIWEMLHWSAVLRAYGGRFLDENGRFALNSPEGRLATEKYRELAPFPYVDFSTGNVGTHLTAPNALSYYTAINPDLQLRALPALRGTDGQRIATAYYWGTVVNRQSEHQTAAWEFLRWLNSAEVKRGLLESVGYPPVTYANISYYTEDLWFRTFAEQFANGRQLPSVRNWNAAEDAITQEITRFLLDEISVAEALENANTRANAATQQ